ncbi:MAG: sensor histidine kinase, partial [Desulfobulbales bacterium]
SAYGLAKFIKNKYRDALGEQGRVCCEQIMRCSEQISLLATDINTYISSRDGEWEFEVLQLKELWDTIRLEFVSQLDRQHVHWLESDIHPPEITGNKIGLVRVLRNLVDNALKYGGDSMSEIVMGYEGSEDYHILKVQNNGAVILPEDEQVIFEEFKRKTDKPQIYGTGLGLAIVKEIAKLHKGSSWLSTTPDGKTVFCVSISRHL